jgi:hypothetical protein
MERIRPHARYTIGAVIVLVKTEMSGWTDDGKKAKNN